MPGGRRGLVAPQNTFLDTLIKKASSQGGDTGFLLINAQIVDFPVVFCSEEFSKLLGFPRSEVMQNSIRCDFMVGALSEKATIGKQQPSDIAVAKVSTSVQNCICKHFNPQYYVSCTYLLLLSFLCPFWQFLIVDGTTFLLEYHGNCNQHNVLE